MYIYKIQTLSQLLRFEVYKAPQKSIIFKFFTCWHILALFGGNWVIILLLRCVGWHFLNEDHIFSNGEHDNRYCWNTKKWGWRVGRKHVWMSDCRPVERGEERGEKSNLMCVSLLCRHSSPLLISLNPSSWTTAWIQHTEYKTIYIFSGQMIFSFKL